VPALFHYALLAQALSEDLGTFEGAWYTDSDLANDAVLAQFKQAYPSSEFITHMMPYAYDSVRMLVDGFESDQGVVDYLRNLTSYDGSAGPITRAAGSGNFRSKPVIWVIKDGRPEVEATGRTLAGPAAANDPDTPPATPEPANPHAPTTTTTAG
jgi:ABC-type branched-subunit amino acid transport system substrate-binding protein